MNSCYMRNLFFCCFFTWKHVESSLFVVSRVSVAGVADDHAGFTHSSISNQHAADHRLRVRLRVRLRRVLVLVLVPLLHTHRRNSRLLIEIIHLGWHVQHRKSEKSVLEDHWSVSKVVRSPHNSQAHTLFSPLSHSHTACTLSTHTRIRVPSPLRDSFA